MANALRQYLRYTSWPIIAAMLGLMIWGVCAIHVSEEAGAFSSAQGSSASAHWRMQMIYWVPALAVFVLMSILPYQKVGRAAYVLFAVTLVVLVALVAIPRMLGENHALVRTVLPGIRGAHRWIKLGPIQVQPSEIAKLTYIILLAWYLRYGDHYRKITGLIVPFILTLIPMTLILKEPDLGTSLLLLPTLYVMLFMAGAKLRHLLGIVVVATALIFMPFPVKSPVDSKDPEDRTRRALSYWSYDSGGEGYVVCAAPLVIMKSHQLKRIDGWLRQEESGISRGIGYQLHQSKMIMGSGRWTGRSDWNNTATYFQMLPDDHTDFIFSVIGGQWGLLGCLGVLFLYGLIFLFGVEIAIVTYDPFGRLLAVGVLALLASQILINIGMTVGLGPITGMTLPLISYGGSSLVVNCAALGLLVNVGYHRPMLLSRRPFEHGERRSKPPAPYGPIAANGRPDFRKM
ncbi:MAG: FtsW/RodA/SpoVE family cell cycle protein [Phycisphaerae bacterium]|jgi:cell division protein FtsW (lipid II flippase)|nr:FtsW/RodA/SpoVE family cell cycle protein [Phycisphaerae bacterium]